MAPHYLRAGFENMARGLGDSKLRWAPRGYLKDGGRVFHNNINPGRTFFAPLVGYLQIFVHWYTECKRHG